MRSRRTRMSGFGGPVGRREIDIQVPVLLVFGELSVKFNTIFLIDPFRVPMVVNIRRQATKKVPETTGHSTAHKTPMQCLARCFPRQGFLSEVFTWLLDFIRNLNWMCVSLSMKQINNNFPNFKWRLEFRYKASSMSFKELFFIHIGTSSGVFA